MRFLALVVLIHTSLLGQWTVTIDPQPMDEKLFGKNPSVQLWVATVRRVGPTATFTRGDIIDTVPVAVADNAIALAILQKRATGTARSGLVDAATAAKDYGPSIVTIAGTLLKNNKLMASGYAAGGLAIALNFFVHRAEARAPAIDPLAGRKFLPVGQEQVGLPDGISDQFWFAGKREPGAVKVGPLVLARDGGGTKVNPMIWIVPSIPAGPGVTPWQVPEGVVSWTSDGEAFGSSDARADWIRNHLKKD